MDTEKLIQELEKYLPEKADLETYLLSKADQHASRFDAEEFFKVYPEWIATLLPGEQVPLHPAPPMPVGFPVNLMGVRYGHPKYALNEQGELIGLNLASLGLTNEQWERIVDVLRRHDVRLQALNLSENRLSRLTPPPNVEALEVLDVSGNELEDVPVDVKKAGNEAILHWLQSKDKRPILEAKVMFIGDSEVGKTHLVEMLIHGKLTRTITTTHGIELNHLKPAKSPEGDIRLNVWDLGGQHFMRSTHQFFFTERTLYVLVTVARTERKDLNYWLELVQKLGGGAPVLIAINKTDLDTHDLDRAALQRDYPNIVGFVRTAVFDNPETGVSAIETIENLQREIHRIVSDKKLMPEVFQLQRPEWFDVKAALEGMDKDFITYERYLELEGVKGLPEDEASTFLKQMSWLGTVVSFVDDPRLMDTHVINPQWLMDGVYAILNDREVKEDNNGCFSYQDLQRILDSKRYPRSRYEFLVGLMEKFRLCYPAPGKQHTYLIPALFSDAEPPNVWSTSDPMRFRFDYKQYPPDLFITQFIVGHYQQIEDGKVWRSGVVIKNDDGCKALVRQSFRYNQIEIQVDGPKNLRRSFLYALVQDFYKLHEPYQNLEVKREIPYKDVWLNYDHLLKYELRGKNYYHPELDEDIPVKEVLDGYRPEEEMASPGGHYPTELLKKIAENTGRTAENTSESLELDKRRNELLEQMSTRLRQVLEDIQGSIESMGERLFANAEEQRKFYEKMMSKLSDTEKEEVEHIWKKGDIKQKLKFSLPFLIGKYEAEIDFSDKRIPRSWKEFKAWFIEEAE
ncbi:MAG: hypothetical protein KatS3mg030_063 [Saprospiraceae bacterium]|nr:MAG: hypothetical protein KatS3mg030_063 [Saprospiraceae bacterium]